jgi:hypothetical protein
MEDRISRDVNREPCFPHIMIMHRKTALPPICRLPPDDNWYDQAGFPLPALMNDEVIRQNPRPVLTEVS